jgi:hypothetical protein
VECVFGISKRGNPGRVSGEQHGIPNVSLNISSADATGDELAGLGLTMDSIFDPVFSSEALYSGFPVAGGDHLLEHNLDPDILHVSHPNLAIPLFTTVLDYPTTPITATNVSAFQPMSFGNNDSPVIHGNTSEGTSALLTRPENEGFEKQSIDSRLLLLSKNLINHRKSIRSPSIHSAGLTFSSTPSLQDKQHGNEHFEESKNVPVKFSLDTTFQLTQVLLDVYSDLAGMSNSHMTQ